MHEKVRDALEDMRDYARTLRDATEGKALPAFLAEEMSKFAVERLLTIIGEAAARVPEYAREGIDLPWKRIVGLRNRLMHAYEVSPEALAEIVAKEVPRMIHVLERTLEDSET